MQVSLPSVSNASTATVASTRQSASPGFQAAIAAAQDISATTSPVTSKAAEHSPSGHGNSDKKNERASYSSDPTKRDANTAQVQTALIPAFPQVQVPLPITMLQDASGGKSSSDAGAASFGQQMTTTTTGTPDGISEQGEIPQSAVTAGEMQGTSTSKPDGANLKGEPAKAGIAATTAKLEDLPASPQMDAAAMQKHPAPQGSAEKTEGSKQISSEATTTKTDGGPSLSISGAADTLPVQSPQLQNAVVSAQAPLEKTGGLPAIKASNASGSKDAAIKQKDSSGSDGVSGSQNKDKVEAAADQNATGSGMPSSNTFKAAEVVASAAVPGSPAGTADGGLQQQLGAAAAPATAAAATGEVQAKAAPAAADHAAAAAASASVSASTPGVSSAQLVQSMHGSEMRIGMHSDEFGSISINTSLTRQTLAAQISFDHSELGKALAVHVPAMQEKLGNAYGVQTRVEVRDGSSTLNGDASAGSANRQGGGNTKGKSRAPTGTEANSIAQKMNSVGIKTARTPAPSTARLDIRI